LDASEEAGEQDGEELSHRVFFFSGSFFQSKAVSMRDGPS
jgi:hypothetical protein